MLEGRAAAEREHGRHEAGNGEAFARHFREQPGAYGIGRPHERATQRERKAQSLAVETLGQIDLVPHQDRRSGHAHGGTQDVTPQEPTARQQSSEKHGQQRP